MSHTEVKILKQTRCINVPFQDVHKEGTKEEPFL